MLNDTNYSDYDDFVKALIAEQEDKLEYLRLIRSFYLFGYSITVTLGLTLNLLVLIAGGYAYHRLQKPDTGVWVLSLAMTHLITASFMTLQFTYVWHNFDWPFEIMLCKLSSYFFYASFFSTGVILSLWSISSAFPQSRCFKNANGPFVMVLASWTLATILSLPSFYSRELRKAEQGMQCIDDYDLDDNKMTEEGKNKLIVVLVFRFTFGILLPLLLIGISCCLTRRQGHGETKLQRIRCLMMVAYFVSWTPLLFLYLIQHTTQEYKSSLKYSLPLATMLASVHCCINPVIYFLISCDIKMEWMNPRMVRPY